MGPFFFSGDMSILGEKGKEDIRNREKWEGRRRTGGRKFQAERTASAKAELGMV